MMLHLTIIYSLVYFRLETMEFYQHEFHSFILSMYNNRACTYAIDKKCINK